MPYLVHLQVTIFHAIVILWPILATTINCKNSIRKF